MAAPTFPFDWPFSLVQPLEPVAAPSRCHRRQQPSTPFNAMPHDPHAAASSSSTPAAHELERASPSVMIASARSTRALSPTSPISQLQPEHEHEKKMRGRQSDARHLCPAARFVSLSSCRQAQLPQRQLCRAPRGIRPAAARDNNQRVGMWMACEETIEMAMRNGKTTRR